MESEERLLFVLWLALNFNLREGAPLLGFIWMMQAIHGLN